MRTTLTIEPAVARRLRGVMEQRQQTLKAVVNEALREGLEAMMKSETQKRKPFVVVPHDFGFLPGIDLNKIGQYADSLEDEEIVAKWQRGK